MGHILNWVVCIGVITYLCIAVFLYIGQRHLLYFPTQENKSINEEFLHWKSGDEIIKVWRTGTGIKALIYFGGNAEDVAVNIPEFQQYFPDHTLYLVNYRGYGGSTGKPTQAGLFEDALNIFDMVNENHENISVMGRSLGSGVAIQLAAQRDVAKLVVVTPFDSVLNLARDMYPIFPVSLLLKDHFDSVGQINKVQTPILILVAEKDSLIPRKRTDVLINAIPTDQVSVRIIKDTSHNDIQNSSDYTDALISFIGDSVK